ncbi:Protein GrpE [Hyphomicrobium sp. 1Nfss2.1]|uniref:nucleotide exchange factor GrpE n=1 Tax=Hyphomicrobium sp. 1Nfss2.1 TaxID=3413936 RepID=UPI003C7C4F80
MADEDKKPDRETAAGGNGAPTGDGEGTVQVLEGRIADLTDRLLRAHAEMDNLRKRTEREKDETAKYAITKFARDLLAVGDNLQRATAAVPAGAADADPALKALIEGVSMTEREFLNVLDRNGVKRMESSGQPFNPHQHQAMVEVDQPDMAPGTIVQVYQEGYNLGDRVLRPAMVVVAKGGEKRPTEGKGAAEPKESDDAA